MYCERGCSRTRADIHDGPEQPRPGLRSDNGAAHGDLLRKGQALAAKPKPHAAGRSELGEARKCGSDGRADGFIGMKADLAILIAPCETDGETLA